MVDTTILVLELKVIRLPLVYISLVRVFLHFPECLLEETTFLVISGEMGVFLQS